MTAPSQPKNSSTRFALFFRIASIVAILGTAAFAIYITLLYQKLERAFQTTPEFVPTRIYSDVTRLSSLQSKKSVLESLNALGYTFKENNENGQYTIAFQLRLIRYPEFLIPENHPTLKLQDQFIFLSFEGDQDDSLLISIRAADQELEDLYLEPQLVATMAQKSEDAPDQIRKHFEFHEFPASLWKAIIAVEDRRYLEHHGFDPRGFLRAQWINLKTFSMRGGGGSTITQQLVKILMVRRTPNSIKKVFEKMSELFLSIALELKYSKEEILERYLNEVNLGQIGNLSVNGFPEGAKYYFGKNIHSLNLAEIALLAGIIRGPFYYSPYRHWERALTRQRVVLKSMVDTGLISTEEAQEAMNMPIELLPPPKAGNKAPYFTDYVKAELIEQLKDRFEEHEISEAGLKVYTTLDLTMNRMAQQAVAEGVKNLEKRYKLSGDDILEGALATVDHKTGFIRALIGGKSYQRSTFNRILNMKRQVGSTFKPIVYLSAFNQLTDSKNTPYGPAYPMKDHPWTLRYDRDTRTWSPQNYSKDYRGWVTLRTALSQSINTIAAQLGVQVGIENIIQTAKALGVESHLPEVPSLALGVAELSPVELLTVYATLANRGVRDELTVIRAITTEDNAPFARFYIRQKPHFEPGPIDLLTHVLQDTFVSGTAQSSIRLGFTRPAAGKTGTTSFYKDSWFAGYTPQLTTVVWVGLDRGLEPSESPTKDDQIQLTGASAALPIWVNFMKKALASTPPSPFPDSEHLSETSINRFSGKIASEACPPSETLRDKYLLEVMDTPPACERTYTDP